MDGVIIGLECHVQLNRLNSKLFCSCSTQYQDAAPNTHTCPVCLGLPGALPVINRRAVEASLKVALALGCEVQEQTLFYRKNYFYPDLPRGFQISQYDFPLAVRGRVLLEEDGRTKEVRITRVHMEEDPGRLTYRGTIDTASHSLVDYNRSGMALMEIVTEPDMRSPREARRFLAKLRNILGYLEVTDGDREGAMRVDANVSIAGGQRVEVKNISSHKGVERALLFEISRQRQMARRGQRIVRETRHYDDVRGITLTLRTKEAEQDYRYFPEPDLVPLRVKGWAPGIRLPELPDAKYERFLKQYGISEHHARVLTGDYKLASLFEEVAQRGVEPKAAATWIADILQGELNYRDEHYRWLLHLAREPERLAPGLRGVRVLPDVGLPFRPDLLGEAPGGPLHVEFELYALDGEGWAEAKKRREALLGRMPGLRSLLVAPGLLEEVPRAEVEAAGYGVVESGPLLGPSRTLAQKTSSAALGPRTPTVPEFTPERVAPEALVELIGLLARGEITDNVAVAVLREMLDEGGRPGEIVGRRGLARAAAGDLGPLLDGVLGENPKAVADMRAGRANALNFLVGQVLKRTGGKADAAEVRRELEKRIPRP